MVVFEFLRKEFEKCRELCRDEEDIQFIDVSWLMDDSWIEGFSIPLALRDAPIEIRRLGWDVSIITSIDELQSCDREVIKNCSDGIYWRRTGIYKEQEERVF